ncbi:GlsB/YeaQ/YmgE family stress response membrane protein [Mycobacterium sp. MBM]|nr:GlsB/YeaQ/YmgE family stress response membrane protein [Mycobacterium sp. MBM]
MSTAAQLYLALAPPAAVTWLSYLVIGGIAGWLAGKLVPSIDTGILLNILIGVVGGYVGGFLLSFFLDTAGGGWWFTLFTAVLGSVILLWIVGLVTKKS